ncbi:reverse transcriptase domain-containing protein [Tanacetum coccineum]
MALKKRTTRASPATTTTTTTTLVTNAHLKALIDQGITDALAAHDADRSMNGNDSHNSGMGVRRQAPLARECTYPDFMKCKPLYFKGTEGVVELTQYALTWWNAHVRTVGHDIAYAMAWTNLKKMMTDKIFLEESDKIKKHVGGLPDMIHRSVMASKPKTMQDAIEFATELMDKKISTLAERQVKNKRKLDNNNQAQQQPPKKQCVAIAYTVGSGERKEYAGTRPLCNKCKFNHNGQCTVKCANCKGIGYLTRDCRSPAATNNQINLTCYECGNQGHYKSDCPKLKNRNHENQAEGTKARGMVYVGPFKVLAKVGAIAYKLEFPQELRRVHHTFHISNLKKCYADKPLAVPLYELHIDDKLHFIEEPAEIMDREVKRLKQSRILIVKVR